MPPLWVVDLGQMEYDAAHALQREAVAARGAGRVPDLLLFVEHPPVYTFGRAGREEHLLVAPENLAAQGATVRRVERGGDITYHGPGQLVGYPILDLEAQGRDLHRYLRGLEHALIAALAEFGVAAQRIPRLTGVWVADCGLRIADCGFGKEQDTAALTPSGVPPSSNPQSAIRNPQSIAPRKIAAIGVAVKRWITYHGFALNVAVDLDRFRAIVPCGLHDRGVVSLHELVPDPSMDAVREAVGRQFAVRFELEAQPVTAETLSTSVALKAGVRR